MYFGKRYYSPALGRWVTPDPAGFIDGPNLYAYVHNRPLSLLDPYGLASTEGKSSSRNESRGWRDYCSDIGRFISMAARNICSRVVHEGYQAASGIRAEGISVARTALSVYPRCVLNLLGPSPEYNDGAAHQTIDRVFSTSQAHLFTSEYQDPQPEYTLCMMPIPGPVRGPARPLSRPVSRQPVDLQIRRINDIMAKALKEPAPEIAFTVDELALAGEQIDRSGLTKAGRALDKHGGREPTNFPKAYGNVMEKNQQGQQHLLDILTHPERRFFNDPVHRGFHYYAPDGRGVFYRYDGSFRGFVQEAL